MIHTEVQKPAQVQTGDPVPHPSDLKKSASPKCPQPNFLLDLCDNLRGQVGTPFGHSNNDYADRGQGPPEGSFSQEYSSICAAPPPLSNKPRQPGDTSGRFHTHQLTSTQTSSQILASLMGTSSLGQDRSLLKAINQPTKARPSELPATLPGVCFSRANRKLKVTGSSVHCCHVAAQTWAGLSHHTAPNHPRCH